MSVNDGYTKSVAMLHLTNSVQSKPCVAMPMLQTSQVVEDSASRIHIIPVDDDEESISLVPPKEKPFIMVDELEKMNSTAHLIPTDDEDSDVQSFQPKERLETLEDAESVSEASSVGSESDDDIEFY